MVSYGTKLCGDPSIIPKQYQMSKWINYKERSGRVPKHVEEKQLEKVFGFPATNF